MLAAATPARNDFTNVDDGRGRRVDSPARNMATTGRQGNGGGTGKCSAGSGEYKYYDAKAVLAPGWNRPGQAPPPPRHAARDTDV